MPTMTRRRSREDDENERDERPTRSRRARDEEPEDERPSRSRRSRARDEEPEDERPTRSRRARDEEPEDERPARSRRARSEGGRASSGRRSRGGEESAGRGRNSRASKGFDAYASKKRSTASFADEFKPADNTPILVKVLDAEPVDTFNQHWLDELPKGTKKSYMCRDDEYFEDSETGRDCPLCEIGEPAQTYSLINLLDLSNPDRPDVVVWKMSPPVTDKMLRLSSSDRTSPLDREDLYFEIEKVVKGKKTSWDIEVVKARDLEEDFDLPPFEADELETFLEKRFEDRTAIQRVDSYDDLDELAERFG